MSDKADRPVVLNLGGSILMPEEPDVDFLVAVAACLAELTEKLGRLFVVVGGGRTARRYINLAREAGRRSEVVGEHGKLAGETGNEMAGNEDGTGSVKMAGKDDSMGGGMGGGKALTEAQLDDLGIDATRLNARLLLGAMQTRGAIVPWDVPEDCHRAETLGQHYDCVVMGGTVPGHTTDAVSAELARRMGAGRLVIATNVDGIYTADPRTHPGAELVERLDFARLIDIVGEPTGEAGVAAVVDPTAARVAADIAASSANAGDASLQGFELAVVDGRNLENLRAACLGEAFKGSLVRG